jgi:hypothetical protein
MHARTARMVPPPLASPQCCQRRRRPRYTAAFVKTALGATSWQTATTANQSCTVGGRGVAWRPTRVAAAAQRSK